jgi:hypothetical protein
MTGSQDMLAAARRGGDRLGPRRDKLRAFLEGCIQPDGSFRGRGPAGDLFYTAFGIDCLLALNQPDAAGKALPFLDACGTGENLDFMHLVSLARCRSRLPSDSPQTATDPARNEALLARLTRYGTPDGGYNTVDNTSHATVTAMFFAWLAYRDLQAPFPDPAGVILALAGLRSADDAYANLPKMAAGTTLATAAALLLLDWLGQPVELGTAQWLFDQYDCRDGGFRASPGAPAPDLLSTATAVYALHSLNLDLSEISPSCRHFVAGLQRPDGGFGGYRADNTSDTEYTFYALITLGCLDPAES